MTFRIRKAVFPVAGLGTRFLPATKTVPKEMLPVVDKPLIQYAVDEAIEAGCDTLVFVTNRYKHSVADYFDKAYELEQKLEAEDEQLRSGTGVHGREQRSGERSDRRGASEPQRRERDASSVSEQHPRLGARFDRLYDDQIGDRVVALGSNARRAGAKAEAPDQYALREVLRLTAAG